MQELIKITESHGEKAVSARELHGFLESKQEFANWIKNRIADYGFIENQDFVRLTNLSSEGRGGQNKKEYIISLDMAKELSMVERNEKGKLARLYFIEMEKRAREHLLKIPAPKIFNEVKCIHYEGWLLQNGYSLMSGQVRARIKKYPEQFRKTDKGWYMSKAIAEYFLNFKNPQQRIAEMPSVNPQWVPMFSQEEMERMMKKK